MGLRDLKNNLVVAQSVAPATKTATAQGSGVDLQGAKSAMVVFNPGTIASGSWTASVEESDTGDTSPDTYTAVAAADLEGTPGALATNTIQKIGYKGTKRYIRGVATTASSPASMPLSIEVVTEPNAKPAA